MVGGWRMGDIKARLGRVAWLCPYEAFELVLLVGLFKMRFQLSTAVTAALGLAASADALKILMGNDDGFGSGNLRELYKMLVDAGHEG